MKIMRFLSVVLLFGFFQSMFYTIKSQKEDIERAVSTIEDCKKYNQVVDDIVGIGEKQYEKCKIESEGSIGYQYLNLDRGKQ